MAFMAQLMAKVCWSSFSKDQEDLRVKAEAPAFWAVSSLILAFIPGSYFATDASYSDKYSSCHNSRSKIMFVALVLVGDYTTGHQSYVKPPAKGNSKTFYNSCVNSESNPKIYVIFDKQQIYPEYLINYS